MSEQDDHDPAPPDRKRRRSGHFDPNEEPPFAAGIDPGSLFGKSRRSEPFDPQAEVPFAEGTGPEPHFGKSRRSEPFDPNAKVPFTDELDSDQLFAKSGHPEESIPEPIDLGPEEDPADRWDADDPRRQHDQMAPPAEPCECYCLHCGRTFMSDGIWFQKVIGSKDGFDGFWMCPTPNCSGAGFTFDIFPTDPAHPANSGWVYDDDEEGEWDEETGDFLPPGESEEPEADYDPDETKYKELDEMWG